MVLENIDHIYIIHYPPLKERKKNLSFELKKRGLLNKTIWITDKDLKGVKQGYNYDKKELEKRELSQDLKKIRKLSNVDKEIVEKHRIALNKVIKNNDEIAIVFEDDAIFFRDFEKRVNNIIFDLKKVDWDICYTSFYSGTINKISPKKVFESYGFRTTGSYIVNKEGAKRLYNSTKKYSLPVDWEFVYQGKKNKMKVFWSKKPISYQGSDYGRYGGSYIDRKGKTSMGNLLRTIESRRFDNKYYRAMSSLVDLIFYIYRKTKKLEV